MLGHLIKNMKDLWSILWGFNCLTGGDWTSKKSSSNYYVVVGNHIDSYVGALIYILTEQFLKSRAFKNDSS